MEIRTIGIDLGKTVFHLVGVNARGEVASIHFESFCMLGGDGGLRRISLSR